MCMCVYIYANDMHSAICYAIQCMSLRVRYCHRLQMLACKVYKRGKKGNDMHCITLHPISSHYTTHYTLHTTHIYTIYIVYRV